MSYFERIFLLSLIAILIRPTFTALESCPEQCFCVFNEAECNNRNLPYIPDGFRENTAILELKDNNLTSVPQLHLKNLKEIYFTENRIKSVDPLAFFELSELEILDLSQNLIEDWNMGWTQSSTKLKRVNFAKNFLPALPAATFSEISNTMLTHANFSFNHIVKIDDNSFHGMISLIDIDLSGNYLSTLKAKPFETLKNLKILNLSGNLIRFPASYDWPVLIAPMLQTLSLANNYIQSANESYPWFETPEMTSLDLSHNAVMELPLRPLDYLPKLQTIYLGGNRMLSIPLSVFRGSVSRSLRHIHITDCPQLVDIHEGAFSNLVGLTSLRISGNPRLFKLPPELAVSHVKNLDISDNKLQSISESLIYWADLQSEERINLDGNPWNCDCQMKWVKKYSFARKIRCATPTNATGQFAANLPVEAFVCAPTIKRVNNQRLYLSITLVVVSICCGVLVLAIVFKRIKCPSTVRGHYRALFGIYDPLEEQGNTVVQFRDGEVTTSTYDEVKNERTMMV